MSTATQLNTLAIAKTEHATVRTSRTDRAEKKPAIAFYDVLTQLTKQRKNGAHHSS